ncbi:deoxynucleoside kinase [Paenibacillus mucilaginosus]|uniref:Deoxynucleoside kinase protein n=2 Tax=Paenibacillus mucilaginosus TaxID=61624 RepID=H6NK77_9BACL|nr:deoxynucleoside kinase [Paenibacillus mucilaginosus]AFC31561.1 deoxynucleoside kinase protein [Paenibacillus mucilaginosus 3016]AFH63906.1 deoxyadenosine kinase [Paenibacillus mucilaginosus K02]MCG7212528.1 deoxynucleoside kinase [Paenibacillus mucilaginosus]WDM25441.1 deoxynucleoside kinase [Paenibacillus mucilaginosus]WFA20100.1 deoxynucleoside kinase [Paenibacillus mucilaginosus]
MSVIVVGGMIGLGKTSVATLLGEALGSDVFFESVDDNPILPLFYTSSPEEIEKKRYPFLLQLHFLNTRFKAIKAALIHNRNVLDRSIYEDWYFAKVNLELGRISPLEFEVYEGLADNMMAELAELPKKAPDLMVYLKASFETVMYRIGLRGRSFEQDASLVEYYRLLWSGYDDWVMNHYKASDVLVIDMDRTDVVNRPEDAERVVNEIKAKLDQMCIV